MSLSDQSLSTRLDSASVSFTGRYINAILLLLLLQPGRHSRLMENMLSIFTIFTQCTTCLSSVLWHCRLSVRLRQSGL